MGPIVAIALIVIITCTALYELWQLQTTPNSSSDGKTLFQISPFNTFSAGNFDGNTTYTELAEHGSFGIGTLNGLNGEMIALDGVFYQIPVSGVPRQIGSNEKTPYATVTFFRADQAFQVTDLNYSQLTTYINGTLPNYGAFTP